jgi:hypothetical protein
MLQHFPPGPGYWLEPCRPDLLAALERAVTPLFEGQGASAQGGLVGNLADQYWLEPPEGLEAWLIDRAQAYHKANAWEPLQQPVKGQHPGAQRLAALWANLQRPGEWNPAHNHTGLFSFVIWLQIPYTFEQERLAPNSRSQMPTHGDFHFEYVDTLGRIRNHSLGADHRLQGYLCLFPAQLRHQVYPYTSTELAPVSISGNLE